MDVVLDEGSRTSKINSVWWAKFPLIHGNLSVDLSVAISANKCYEKNGEEGGDCDALCEHFSKLAMLDGTQTLDGHGDSFACVSIERTAPSQMTKVARRRAEGIASRKEKRR